MFGYSPKVLCQVTSGSMKKGLTLCLVAHQRYFTKQLLALLRTVLTLCLDARICIGSSENSTVMSCIWQEGFKATLISVWRLFATNWSQECAQINVPWISILILPPSAPETCYFSHQAWPARCVTLGLACAILEVLTAVWTLAGGGSCQFWGEEGPAVCPQSHQGLEKAAETEAHAVVCRRWGLRWVGQVVWLKCTVQCENNLENCKFECIYRCVVLFFFFFSCHRQPSCRYLGCDLITLCFVNVITWQV